MCVYTYTYFICNYSINIISINKNGNEKKFSNSTDNTMDLNTLNENVISLLKGSNTGKIVKYIFYLGIFLVILLLSLWLIKFCITVRDTERPIKTKHSINEIEDELNNMKEREKLF